MQSTILYDKKYFIRNSYLVGYVATLTLCQSIVILPYRSKYTQSLEKTHHHMLGTRIRGELLNIVLIMIMIYVGMK